MMTPKMKEDLCTQILNASRQLFLSSKISEVCQEKEHKNSWSLSWTYEQRAYLA